MILSTMGCLGNPISKETKDIMVGTWTAWTSQASRGYGGQDGRGDSSVNMAQFLGNKIELVEGLLIYRWCTSLKPAFYYFT